jgi:hypothetical protein
VGRDTSGVTKLSAAPVWKARAPLLLVAVAVVFNLWAFRDEVRAVESPNDTGLHMQMVHWAGDRIDDGHLPLDGWYPYLQLGSPQFHQYQSTPHVLTAYMGQVVGEDRAYRWSTFLLLALWPITIYAGARLFEADRWIAGAAALLSSLLVSAPAYGYESGSYLWRGLGVWPQLWGMCALPLALGFTWRAIKDGRSYAWAALFVALATAFNFIAGYLALLLIPIIALTTSGAWLPRLRRAAGVGLGSVLVGSWVIVPLVSDSGWVNSSPYFRDHFWNDSFGAGQVLGWLVRGQLFDDGRLPVITILAAAGFVACVFAVRTEPKARVLLAISGVSFLLFFGRPTLGPILDLLPGSSDLMFHRFIIGVHLSGLALAAVGAVAIVRTGPRYLERIRLDRRVALTIPYLIVGLALVPAIRERAAYAGQNGRWIAEQQVPDSSDGADVAALVAEAKAHGPGRVYAGLRNNWGVNYKVGFVPVYAILATHDVDAIGFTFRTVTGLSTDLEPLFDETDPFDYWLFDIRYMLIPSDSEPPVEATLLDQRGRHSLYEVAGRGGYMDVVDTTSVIEADRGSVAEVMGPLLASDSLAASGFPLVSFGGREAGVPTTISPVTGEAGSVESESDDPAGGRFEATVVAERPAEVLLKTSFHPRWTAFVDGVEVAPRMVAPSFVGAPVTAGAHTVEFVYRPYPLYLLWLAIGALTLVALATWPRWWELLAIRARRSG